MAGHIEFLIYLIGSPYSLSMIPTLCMYLKQGTMPPDRNSWQLHHSVPQKLWPLFDMEVLAAITAIEESQLQN